MSEPLDTGTKKKSRERPATGKGEQVAVRMQPDLLSWLDAEREQIEPMPTRPELIRLYLEERRGHVIVKE